MKIIACKKIYYVNHYYSALNNITKQIKPKFVKSNKI